MSPSIFLLWLVSIPSLVYSVPAQPQGYLLTCGSSGEQTMPDTGIMYVPDDGFTNVGNKTAINDKDLLPILTTLRYFPDESARKYCYEFRVNKGGKYLVRTIYYYGGFDGGKVPPVFDQIIGGTKWSVVNTTEDYANGQSSYYEIILVAPSKILSVCLARSANTSTSSSPFISAIEVLDLGDDFYKLTKFSSYALVTVARSTFGGEDSISFPDDPRYRLWQPFKDNNTVTTSQTGISTSELSNQPPAKAFETAITTTPGQKLELQWPPLSLPSTKYYISLYFQDIRKPSADSWRVFSVLVNGNTFYSNLNVTTGGVTVSSKGWPLSGQTKISLIPDAKSSDAPLINAGEVYQIMPLGGRTLPRDEAAMVELARKFDKKPPDWVGDPCRPVENSWTGVSCSQDGLARVISLDLTNHGLVGELSPSIDHLTALHHIRLGGNNISGSIPEMPSLHQLETLHLERNIFTGPIPQSLGKIGNLREVFLQDNKLDGPVPKALQEKPGINLQVSNPGTNNVSA